MSFGVVMQRPFVALGLLALGMAVIPLNDAIIKLLSGDMPLAQIVAVRAVIGTFLVAILTNGMRQMLGLSASAFWQFFGRGMCLVVAMVLFFIPLGSLPLPTVVSIFFIAPLLITLLSVPFLGETIGIHRIASVVIGMIGVLLIIRPGSADFQPETLLVLLAALSYATFQIWTRRLKSVGNLNAMVAVQHVCYLCASVPALLFNWVWPVAPTGNISLDFMGRAPISLGMTEFGLIGVCALTVLLLSFASSNAYRVVEASLIAPFEYTAIPLGVFWGIVIWGDWPDALAWFGMALILGGGLYAVYREKERNVTVASSSPMPVSAAIAQNDKEDMGPDTR